MAMIATMGLGVITGGGHVTVRGGRAEEREEVSMARLVAERTDTDYVILSAMGFMLREGSSGG